MHIIKNSTCRCFALIVTDSKEDLHSFMLMF